MSMESNRPESSTRLREALRSLNERYAVFPQANSVDGWTFVFRCPIILFLNLGAYMRINAPGHLASSASKVVRIALASSWLSRSASTSLVSVCVVIC